MIEVTNIGIGLTFLDKTYFILLWREGRGIEPHTLLQNQIIKSGFEASGALRYKTSIKIKNSNNTL